MNDIIEQLSSQIEEESKYVQAIKQELEKAEKKKERLRQRKLELLLSINH